MKTSDIGLLFDDKLSRSNWANWVNVTWVTGTPDELWFGTVPTLLGAMTIIGADDALCYVGFVETRCIDKCRKLFLSADFSVDTQRAEKMAKTILKTWGGDTDTSLKIMVCGTDFQQQVWRALIKIPAGHVVSYGTIADAIGKPAAVRAVGTAVGANPISLIIPCHRVVQKNGNVENYMWGDAMKQNILRTEVIQISKNPASRKIRRVV